MKKKILLIPIGGTIAANVPERTSPLYVSGEAGIEATIASLTDLSSVVEIETQRLFVDRQEISCHSSSLTQSALLQLSSMVSEALGRSEIAGVIVTQGTDTLEETAFLLQLTVQSSKPVVLTGAMRPLAYGSPDGPDNIRCAVKYILHSDIQSGRQSCGVVVAFQFKIFSAFNVTKVLSYPPTVVGRSEQLPCPFLSPAFGPIGEISHSSVDTDQWKLNWNQESRFFKEQSKFEKLKFDALPSAKLPMVPILPQYLGNDSGDLIKTWYLEKHPEVSCFILEGNGNGSISESLKKVVTELKVNRDLAFIRSSKVPTTWCIDDQLNYPGTIGARILSSVQARILSQLTIRNSKSEIGKTVAQTFETFVPTPLAFDFA